LLAVNFLNRLERTDYIVVVGGFWLIEASAVSASDNFRLVSFKFFLC
jgi:hypothetical protein